MRKAKVMVSNVHAKTGKTQISYGKIITEADVLNFDALAMSGMIEIIEEPSDEPTVEKKTTKKKISVKKTEESEDKKGE